jgi:arginine decarboxylase
VRLELASVPGITLLDETVLNNEGSIAVDPIKILVNTRKLGMSGYELERHLRIRYRLQAELSDLYNTLFLVTIGDNEQTVRTLVDTLKAVSKNRGQCNIVKYPAYLPELPELVLSPAEAFHSETRLVSIENAEGEISAEMVMAYPPGIPLICPGERFTREIIDYIRILKTEQLHLQGTEDLTVSNIKVVKNPTQIVCSSKSFARVVS